MKCPVFPRHLTYPALCTIRSSLVDSLGGDGPSAGQGTPYTATISKSSSGSAMRVVDDPDPFGEAEKARKQSVEREQYRARFDAEMLQ